MGRGKFTILSFKLFFPNNIKKLTDIVENSKRGQITALLFLKLARRSLAAQNKNCKYISPNLLAIEACSS